MALIGLYSGSYILKHKDERGFKLGKSRQTAKSAYNGIVEKYGVVKPGSKYHHVGNKVWRIYLIKNDRKRTGKTTNDFKKWGKQPHKWDYKGVDTKGSTEARKKRIALKRLNVTKPVGHTKNGKSVQIGKNVYESSVINAIVGLSVSKDYNKAKTEWDFLGNVIDYGPLKDQKPKQKCNLCGHPLRYAYVLNNKVNKKRVEVGSECVENFMNITHGLISSMEKAKKNVKKEAARKYRDTYLRARMEAEKVSDVVFKGTITNDKNAIGAVGNNEAVLYKYAKSGLIYDMAKKYNVPIIKEKIEAFINIYKKD